MRQRHAATFGRMPLFFIGLAFSLGVYFLLKPAILPLLLFCFLLSFFLLSTRHVCFLLVVFGLGFTWSKATICYPPFESSTYGTFLVEPTNIVEYELHKKRMWRCDLLIQKGEGNLAQIRGVRAMMFYKDLCPLSAGGLFQVEGVLEHKMPFCLTLLKPKKCERVGTPSFSFVVERSWVRDRLMKALSSICRDDGTIMLLGTMCFSLPCSQDMRRSIHKVGLDHILGVSGVHFGQLACIVALAASFLRRWAFAAVVWSFLTLFFFIVGPIPSVFRAWIVATLCVGQRLFSRQVDGLNSLGVGLLTLALFDPGMLTTLSLQLSFLATAALVTWYPIYLRAVERLFTRYKPQMVWNFSLVDQFLFFVLRVVRMASALVLSIAFLMVPYQLAYLSDFPILGVLVNLFLPVFFDIALLVTFFTIAVYTIIPIAGMALGRILEGYVQMLLAVVQEMPSPSWNIVQGITLSEHFVSLYIAFFLLLGIFLRLRSTSNEEFHPLLQVM